MKAGDVHLPAAGDRPRFSCAFNEGKAVRLPALLHLRQRICLRETDLP